MFETSVHVRDWDEWSIQARRRRQWRYDSVSIWIEASNCGVDILVDKTQSVVLVDIPYVIGCRDVCASWNKGLVTWFGELSWHLKVPWNLISAKRIPKHRVPTQIKGGTAAVGGFKFRRQWRYDSVSIWIEVSNCGVDILVARNFLETIQFGCHVGGLPFGREKIAFWTLLQRLFWQKTISCSRGHSLRDWLPWCLWIVKQGLGYLVWRTVLTP